MTPVAAPCRFMRTPRPKPPLTTPSPSNSMPANSNADTSLPGVDIASDDAVAGFHALDSLMRQPGAFCQGSLVQTQQSASGTKLRGGY